MLVLAPYFYELVYSKESYLSIETTNFEQEKLYSEQLDRLLGDLKIDTVILQIPNSEKFADVFLRKNVKRVVYFQQ